MKLRSTPSSLQAAAASAMLCFGHLGLASIIPADMELVHRRHNNGFEKRCDGKINGYTQRADCTGDFFEWTNLCDTGASCVTNIDGSGNPTQLHSLYQYDSVDGFHIRIWSGPFCTGTIITNYFASTGCRANAGNAVFGSFSFV
ncbi:hypothetical protein B0H66DRAFT_374270 [Apodospora peruviana]|uniref:Uncharacterized protein n=1 Tax=Apodospora peruviana TaxID=516989 RepID=A0AAE0HWT5_9PEZI|nr:hypothetical protein B0H66DRAFT_374270 [Apodospora peruviana]